MDHSEEQFKELIGNLVVRANNALKVSDQVPPMSLALDGTGNIDAGVADADDSASLSEVLNAMQDALSQRASRGEIVASCIAFAKYDEGCIEALLENSDNYCATVKIPVTSAAAGLSLSLQDMAVEDGSVYVFPLVSDS